jgi:hypothetical protein
MKFFAKEATEVQNGVPEDMVYEKNSNKGYTPYTYYI